MKKLGRCGPKSRTLDNSTRRNMSTTGRISVTSNFILNSKILILLLIACWFSAVFAQYGGQLTSDESGGGVHYGAGDGAGYDNGMDERPKLRLGIRLRIPAFKFELPRFSLPKITVSAKIRQPDRPRVINLPEINLDTTSKVEPPASKMRANGGYGGHNSYGAGDYATSYGNHGPAQEEKSQTFTFSTAEETHPFYGNNHGTNNNHRQGFHTNMRPMQHSGYRQMGSYGMQQSQRDYTHEANFPASRAKTIYNHSPGNSYQAHSFHGTPSTSTSYTSPMPDKSTDIGFNSPVNASPHQASHNHPEISSER